MLAFLLMLNIALAITLIKVRHNATGNSSGQRDKCKPLGVVSHKERKRFAPAHH